METFIFILALLVFIGFIGYEIYNKIKKQNDNIKPEETKHDIYF